MASEIILNSPIFINYILPFVLVFAIIFAILERSNIFGEGKKQVNALIGLVIGLILVAFPASRDVVVKLMPVLAVMIVILLIFMIIYGFAKQTGEIKLPRPAIYWILIIAVTVVIITLMKITGTWDSFISYIKTSNGEKIFANVVLIAAVIAAANAVWQMKGRE